MRATFAQMFFNTLYLELALLCLLHQPIYSSAAEAARDRSGGGGRRQRGGGSQEVFSSPSALELNAGFFGVSVAEVFQRFRITSRPLLASNPREPSSSSSQVLTQGLVVALSLIHI